METDKIKAAGLSRNEFAKLCGVHPKTTYWKVPPRWAVELLELKIENEKLKRLREVLREVVKEEK